MKHEKYRGERLGKKSQGLYTSSQIQNRKHNKEKIDTTTVYDDAHTNMLHINSASTVCKWDWNIGESK